MIENARSVPIGKIVTSDVRRDVLVAYGLGSCVAVCLYDPVAQVGGMLHALLPSTPDSVPGENGRVPLSAAKFVDQGTLMLIKDLVELGAQRDRLIAQLCGGAQTLSAPGFEDDILNVGERNARSAEEILCAEGIWIQARATGGNMGRTVRFYIADGQVTVKSLGQGVQVLVLDMDSEMPSPSVKMGSQDMKQEVCYGQSNGCRR
ncbi:MAG: chemotaxis protein CheD [Chloroflexi bacterium]|nr:chemotaxis protein CheD [Chloroflexota bacterium]